MPEEEKLDNEGIKEIVKKVITVLSMAEEKLLEFIPEEYRKQVKYAINILIALGAVVIAALELF